MGCVWHDIKAVNTDTTLVPFDLIPATKDSRNDKFFYLRQHLILPHLIFWILLIQVLFELLQVPHVIWHFVDHVLVFLSPFYFFADHVVS